jgi:hypothetical protein
MRIIICWPLTLIRRTNINFISYDQNYLREEDAIQAALYVRHRHIIEIVKVIVSQHTETEDQFGHWNFVLNDYRETKCMRQPQMNHSRITRAKKIITNHWPASSFVFRRKHSNSNTGILETLPCQYIFCRMIRKEIIHSTLQEMQ